MDALKNRFPFLGEKLRVLAEILLFAAEEGKISFDDIHGEGREEILILAVEERLLIPVRTSRSLAWEDRILRLEPGEVYEMPNVVRYLVKRANETGRWEPCHAINEYLEEIGEEERESIVDFFEKVRSRVKDRIVDVEVLKEVLKEVGLRVELGKVIAELKGGGIISPHLRISIPSGIIKYEINPSLL